MSQICDRCGNDRPNGRTRYCEQCREALAYLYLGSPLPVWKLREKYGVSDVSLVRWAYKYIGVGREDVPQHQRQVYLAEYRRRFGNNIPAA